MASDRFDASSAPYLSDATGLFFDDYTDFIEKFKYWHANKNNFYPRKWVADNLTYKRSAQLLIDDVYSKIYD